MIRVMMIGPYPADVTKFDGGVQTSFHNLVQGLSSFDDVEPHVFTLATGTDAIRRSHDGPAPVTYLPAQQRLNNLTLYRNHRRLVRDACRALRPDVVHAQDVVGYGYVTLRAVHDTPVVLSIHGIVSEELKHLHTRRDRVRTSVARVRLQQYCIRNARHLIQPSAYPEAYFGEQIRGRITNVGNPIADAFFAGPPRATPGRLLYVGGVTPGKRVIDLIDVLAIVAQSTPSAHLRIAGGLGDTDYVQQVRHRIAERGLTDAVTFLGPLPVPQLVEEYLRSSVFVLASGQENSPMVIGEAMAGGLPVVATDTGGVRSLVAEGETGHVVDVGAIEHFAERVTQLLQDEDARARYGEASRSTAEARFRTTQVADRVRSVYLEALADANHEPSGL